MERYFVYMYINGEYIKCALLAYNGNNYSLGYGKKYLERKDRIPIDPLNLPLYEKLFESTKVFGAIKDSSPDKWGRYLLEKRFNRDLTEMEYILANGINHVGALAFSPDNFDSPMRLTPRGYVKHKIDSIELKVIMDQTEMVLENEADEDKINELLNYGPSLGGARPKYSINLNERPYLTKYSTSYDKRREPLIEYACMSMAKELKLEVPDIKLDRIANRDIFYIKRFDRERKGEEILHFPFLSALSLAGWDEGDHRDWSYLQLTEHLTKIASNEKEINQDLRELFRRIAFNIAVNNDDDHPKNHGVLYRDNSWRLSPLYDVVTKDVRTHTFRLAMDLGIQRREASKKNLLSMCEYFKVDKEEGEKLINEVFDFVENNWKEYFKQAGLNDRDLERFEIAFTRKE